MEKSPHVQPHIDLQSELPGIMGLFRTFPDTAKPMRELAEVLLSHDSATFSKAERETIASYVSFLNGCIFCSESHAAVADFHSLAPTCKLVWQDATTAPVSERLKALLRIARQVQSSGRNVAREDVENALRSGATERDVHDTVLIAAAFCMFNRYVDGLGTYAPPPGDQVYHESEKLLGTHGYLKPIMK